VSLGEKSLSNKGVRKGYPLFTANGSSCIKRLQIGTDMLLIISSTGDELFMGINIDVLELSK